MEVLAIDWENIDSRFVRDDAYEGINAPKWVDFLALEDPTDEVSFFAGPIASIQSPLQTSTCAGPPQIQGKKSASLLRSSSKSPATPLREMNRRELKSKSRAVVSSSVTSPAELSSPKKTKSPYHQTTFFYAECENRDPNSPASVNSARKSKCTNELKMDKQVQGQNLFQRPAAATKERKLEKPEPETPTKAPPPLRSVRSARNLFVGRDILNQISEFCTELKKLALNGNRVAGQPLNPETAKSTTVAKEHLGKESKGNGIDAASSTDENQTKKPLNSSRKENSSKNVEGKMGGQRPEWKITGKINGRSNSSNNRIRSAPPTPQKFPPHPSALKPPMVSPLRSSSTISISMEERMRSLEKSPANRKMRIAGEELQEDNMAISPLVDRSLDLFWFLKPCSLPSRK